MKIKYIVSLLLSLSMSLSLISCNFLKKDGVEDITEEETSDVVEETEKVKYVYKTKYVDFEFVSDKEKAEWKSALVSLLSNPRSELYENEEGKVSSSCPYPDRPSIAKGYQIALFDINVDGVPELLVNEGGGSAGNAFYYVYDILSGEEIGTLDGGHDNAWCIYFNQSTGKYEAIGQFEWRIGWMGKTRFVGKAEITNTMAGIDAYLYESSLMVATYDIDAAEVELSDEDKENGIQSAWEEVYPGVKFWVNGDSATIEEYFAAQDNFTENYIRIPETGILLFAWDDVADKDDSTDVRAEKMADALLASKQKFLSGSLEALEIEN